MSARAGKQPRSMPYPHLFSPFTLGSVTLKNRVVMAPMSTELGAKDGSVTAEMLAFYKERARGGIGLIIVEYTCVEPDTGRAHDHQLTLESRRNLEGHVRLVQTVHDAGAKIFMQLQHSGRYANASVLPGGMPVGPSIVTSRKDPAKLYARALESQEIERLIDSFGRTVALAIEAGYDGVELHGAHGYLLTQFMSPLTNQRDDDWGGDFARRLAFPLAVVKRVKAAIGPAPLSYRISADEFTEGGLTLAETETIAPLLAAAGADVIHVSTGRGDTAFETVVEPMSATEGWRIPYARRLRAAAQIPVIAVGQIRWPETGEQAIAMGDADLIALGRPTLADPDWANKARAGRRDEIRPCTSCNWCISPHPGRVQVGCAENPRAGSELDAPIPEGVGRGRRAVVVGAGPGGIVAALLLDQAGFATELYEARPQAGGGLIASATPPGKDKLFWYMTYLQRRLAASAVRLHLDYVIDPQSLVAARPDVTIIAAGTESRVMPIEGRGDPMVVEAFDMLMGDLDPGVSAGGSAIVYGGGETGCETAEFLAHRGIATVLVTRSPRDRLARSAERVYRGGLVRRLLANPAIAIIDNSEIVRVGNGQVVLRHRDGGERILAADRLLIAQGRQPSDGFSAELIAAGLSCIVIGDSRTIGRIGDAVHDAYRAVQSLCVRFSPVPRLAC